MVRVRLGHVVARSVEVTVPGVANELARLVEVDLRAAARVTVEASLRHRDAVDRVPLLRPQVQQVYLDPRKGATAGGNQLVEPAVRADPIEGRVGLRCVADRDRPLPVEAAADPPHDSVDDDRMCHDVFPPVGARVPLVVLLHPVRLQHDAVARADEIGRELERGERRLDRVAHALPVVVGRRGLDDTHSRRACGHVERLGRGGHCGVRPHPPGAGPTTASARAAATRTGGRSGWSGWKQPPWHQPALGRAPAVAAMNAARTGSHFGDTPRSWTSGSSNSRSTSRASARRPIRSRR